MTDFETELKQGFLEEAAQLLSDAERCFLTLETSPDDPTVIDQLFRLAHNLKGSGKAVGFSDLGNFTHKLESLLLKIKKKEINIQKSVIDLLLKCNDHLQGWIRALQSNIDESIDSAVLLAEMDAYLDGTAGNEVPQEEHQSSDPSTDDAAAQSSETEVAADSCPYPPADAFPDEDVQATEVQVAIESPNLDVPLTFNVPDELNASFPVSSSLNDDLVNLFQAMDAPFVNPLQGSAVADAATALAPTAAAQTKVEPKEVTGQAAQIISISRSTPAAPEAPKAASAEKGPAKVTSAKPDESIRVSLARLEKLINFVGEMVILQSVLREQSHAGQILSVRKTIHQLGKVTKEVQDISMSLRMIPLKQIFQKMQRIVRDTSASLNKKVDLTLEGEDTEVDKTVLESLGDPLVHLIRNAVDHGIESAAARLADGKPEEGRVLLKAYHQSGSLIIEIRDDGAGLDPAKLKAKAIEKGIIRANAVLSDAEAWQLIFAPGFSTKTEVTDVSGRGVGMDVVRTNIDALEGNIQIDSVIGKGTCFKIQLPLTLAIIDGMIVKAAGERFVIPLSHVHETIKPSEKDVHFLTGVGEVFALRGENLPLHYLGRLLGKKPPTTPAPQSTAIVVRGQKQAFAVMVDEIVGQAQVVIKQLGQEHKDLRGFSASAILGDGRPALILELEDLKARTPVAPQAAVRRNA